MVRRVAQLVVLHRVQRLSFIEFPGRQTKDIDMQHAHKDKQVGALAVISIANESQSTSRLCAFVL